MDIIDIIDKIKKIKLSRMEPEEVFILDIINKVKQCSVNDSNKFLKYKIDGNLIFSYDKRFKSLWIDYFIIHEINSYCDNMKNTHELIEKYFKKYLHDDYINHITYGSPRKKNII